MLEDLHGTALATGRIRWDGIVGCSGNLTFYTWDFGDGSTGSGATVSHTYGAIGTYTVTLTVGNGVASPIRM
jgi:chitodextrinase